MTTPLRWTLPAIALFFALLGAASPAHAQGGCAAIGGQSIGGECVVSAPVTLGGSSLTFTIPQTLRIASTGRLTIPSTLAPATLTINVTGSFVMEAGARIVGDVDDTPPAPPAPDLRGAMRSPQITITASQDVTLDGPTGTGVSGAAISANSSFQTCATGRAGAVTVTAGRAVRLGRASRIDASGVCPVGPIVITSGDGPIEIAGLVQAASGLVPGGATGRGGAIEINAASDLTVTSTGIVSSRGNNPGADLVHLSGGRDVAIRGRVESTGGVAPTLPANQCASAARIAAGKPAAATACVEVWAGGRLTIDATNGNAGEINADTQPEGVATTGGCCAWVDLFAMGDITILGAAIDNEFGAFAVHAVQSADDLVYGGLVTVKAVRGKVVMDGLGIAVNANFGSRPALGESGRVIVEAGGANLYVETAQRCVSAGVPSGCDARLPDVSGNVQLSGAWIFALNLSTAGAGGSVRIRSYNGSILGHQPGFIAATGPTVGSSRLETNVCGAVDYTGTTEPPAEIPTFDCGGAPQLPPFVVLPTYKPAPLITMTVDALIVPAGGQRSFGCVAAGCVTPHPLAATVTGTNGEPLPFTLVLSMDGAPFVGVPTAAGTYVGTATFVGTETYRAASASVTVLINRGALVPRIILGSMFVNGTATVTYDGVRHPAQATVVGVNGEDLGQLTYGYTPGGAQAPKDAGSYSVLISFAGNAEYSATSTTAAIVIRKAMPTVTMAGATYTYNGEQRPATSLAITGVVTSGVTEQLGTLAPVYTIGGVPTPNNEPPRGAGTYLATASFTGSPNYNDVTELQVTIQINKALPVLSATGNTCAYTGAPCLASGTIRGGSATETLTGTFTYAREGVALPSNGQPINPGVYGATFWFAGNATHLAVLPGSAGAPIVTVTITKVRPTIVIADAEFVADGSPKPVTGAVVGIADASLGAPRLTYLREGVALSGPPSAVGTYTVRAEYEVSASNPTYLSALPVTVTLTILSRPRPPEESCVVVDFREITYFRGKRVLTSSNANVCHVNGAGTGFDPDRWPYSPKGKGDTTTSRGTEFRIYGFVEDVEGRGVIDVDHPDSMPLPIVPDPDIPGAYYVDLGGPARVLVCPSQLQNALIDDSSPTAPGTLPDTTVLSAAERNVPGIMLTHNSAVIDIPSRVRAELATLPGLGLGGATKGTVHYIGAQLWGRGDEDYREFVNVQISFPADDLVDRDLHYRYGLHTVTNASGEPFVGCEYRDYEPGDVMARLPDNWTGTHVGDPNWGGKCGYREPSSNQRQRANYAVPFDSVQLLPTVSTGHQTVRIYYGTIEPALSAPSCAAATASPSQVWPPNHKLVPIKINGITNTDAGPVSVKITGVRQDEPTNICGDGNTHFDASVSGGNVSVRAERMGGGNGRVYEIAFTATNAGGSCSGTVRVGVPHDQGKPAIQDSKVRYDSLTGKKLY